MACHVGEKDTQKDYVIRKEKLLPNSTYFTYFTYAKCAKVLSNASSTLGEKGRLREVFRFDDMVLLKLFHASSMRADSSERVALHPNS